MTKKKIVLNYLEKFLFSIVLLIFTCSSILSLTVLNKSYVKSMLTDEHYEKVEKALKTEMKNSMISSGLDDEIIDDMFTSRDVKITSEKVLDVVYSVDNKDIETTDIENKLRENIKNNLNKKGFSLSDEAGYNEFVDSVMDIYRGEFIMLDQLPKVSKLVKIAKKVFGALALIFGAITIIWMVIRKKRLYRFVPVGLFTTSFFIIFSCLYINREAELTGITIISVTFSEFLRKLISSTFGICIIVAMIYLFIGVLILSVRKYHRHRHHSEYDYE